MPAPAQRLHPVAMVALDEFKTSTQPYNARTVRPTDLDFKRNIAAAVVASYARPLDHV